MASSTSWEPPPLSTLNVSDCESATSWAAAYIFARTNNKTSLDVPVPLMNYYLRSMIPRNISQPSELELTAWSLDLFNDPSKGENSPEYKDWFDKAWDLPITQCDRTICTKIEWEGDPDVSGIGVRST